VYCEGILIPGNVYPVGPGGRGRIPGVYPGIVYCEGVLIPGNVYPVGPDG
jgi:hypothetical protein